MPMPVSLTLTQSKISSSEIFLNVTVKVTPPFSVYLTALVKIFVITCLIRISSPKSSLGKFSSASMWNANSFFSARFWTILTKSLSNELNAYSTGIISILPASIFEKSKMSLTIPSKEFPALLIFSAYSRMVSFSDSRRIISFIPKIALMGVRISWLIFERNCDLDLLAALAAMTASFNASFFDLSSSVVTSKKAARRFASGTMPSRFSLIVGAA